VTSVVERTLIRPPASQLGPIDPTVRAQLIAGSVMGAKYRQSIDRDSAYERLQRRAAQAAQEAAQAQSPATQDAAPEFQNARRYQPSSLPRSPKPSKAAASRSDSIGTTLAKSFARSLGSKAGQQLVRGVLGSLFKSR
jgi:uncharacterized protein